ncbi:MAG TPA: UvrD-helicase domain-containing protein [Candidatus Binatia bacterium]|nr:UvrD-helicase domain-containing protein [Candidatus Binatia bacterium]
MIDLDALNAPQREAVTHLGTPLLVLAGAGSGKTRVLTYRVAHLIAAHGVRPEEILAVTFTNKAAREMRERLAALLGDASGGLTVGTFHSTCARWLRREAPALGLPSAFAIYDDADQLALCRRALAEAGVADEEVSPAALRAFLDRRKNDAEPIGDDQLAASGRGEALVRAALRYDELLRRAGALDFGGLITGMVDVLAGDPERRERYRSRYRHVLVDEYQDINRAQYLLIQQLAGRSPHLAVVGDDDQSIYAFRGATVRAILDFERDHPDAHVVRLEQNYRSTGHILGAASAVIRQNEGRHGKRLWTDKGDGEPVVIATLPDDRAEARYVAGEVAAGLARGLDLAEIAICYRTNAQSRLIEEELVRRGFRYVLIGGTRFYDRKEVKDALAYLRLLVNPSDDVSLTRVINVPSRGIGATTVAALAAEARRAGGSIAEVLDGLAEGRDVPDLNAASRKRVLEFWAMIARLRSAVARAALAETVEQVLAETGLVARLRGERTEEGEARAENLDELVSAAREVDALDGAEDGLSAVEAFLERAALVTDLDGLDGRRSAVTLMTLHNSKGLEFPLVVLTGMEERVFPHARAIDEGDVEEERRLCYVGMTRARQRLVLTRARNRILFGVAQQNPASRFLREIPAEYVEARGTWVGDAATAVRAASGLAWGDSRRAPWHDREASASREPTIDYSYGQEQPASGGRSIRVGTRVRHPDFGAGVVRRTEGDGEAAKLTVQFERAGLKKLILRFAPLEVI